MSKLKTRLDFPGSVDFPSMDERHRSSVELGSMMRAERERYGLTHSQFAQALGVQASEILRLERGRHAGDLTGG